MLGENRTRPQSKAVWILWWRVDHDELQDQVEKYDTLGWFESGRKLSVVCLLFSVAVSVLLTAIKVIPKEAYAEAALFLILAVFIYLGHRWAMIAAMVVWTIEKASTAITGFGAIGIGPNILVSLLWWAAFMHAFYLAFRVEQQRRQTGITISHV